MGSSPQILGAVGSSGREPLPQIDSLDLEGYVGKWYQVAALPAPFNLQCAKDTTAEYAVEDVEGAPQISVRNTCTDWFGNRSSVSGHARVQDTDTNASLRVWFDGIPFQRVEGPTNYRVTWRSADGETVLVGSPERLSGFVLSRTPAVSPERWDEVRAAIAERGWPRGVFFTTPVTGGESTIHPL